ncbi:MAG: glycosyl transferase, partial [Pseudomonadota bacterium]
ILRRPSLRPLRALWGIPLMALLVLPWLVAIWQISDGGFFAESLGKDLAGKLAEGQEKHWGPPGLYTLLIWGTFWPWAALIPLAAPWLWRLRREPWLILLAAWVLPFWLILEIVPTKLPHYVLPLYPALAIALAAWVEGRRVPAQDWFKRVSAGLVAVPGILLGLAAIALPLALEGYAPVFSVPLSVAGIGLAILAARAALQGRLTGQILASALAALCLYPAVLAFSLPAMSTVFPSPRIADAAAQWRPCASGPLITAGYREPSLVFLTETRTDRATPREVAALLSDPGALFLIEPRWWPLIEPHLSGPRPDLIARAEFRYFNYNRGKTETAILYTSEDPRWLPCILPSG